MGQQIWDGLVRLDSPPRLRDRAQLLRLGNARRILWRGNPSMESHS